MNNDTKEEINAPEQEQELPEALQKKQERLEKQEEQLEKQQKNIKKIKRRNTLLNVLNTLFTAVFVVVCLFSIYRRYDETVIYEKPAEVDDNQKKMDENQKQTPENPSNPPDEVQQAEIPSEVPAETSGTDDGQGHFTIYSVGDVYTAESGSGDLHCDVRNTEDSTHDIIMSIYLSEDELKKHGLNTEGVEGGQWLIAQSGMFEPGYQITSVQLLALPDGSYLPAGTYEAIMNEKYYHHQTGTLASYEGNIPVTLEVAN